MSVLLFSLLLLFLVGLSHSLKPFTVTDNQSLKRIDSPTVSLDKTLVAYTIRTWNSTTNVSTTGLGLLNLSTNTSKQLTYKTGNSDYSPTFSPKGDVVAFLSSRSGSTQIFTIPVDGSDSDIQQLSNYSVEIDSLEWSSSGYLAFSARIYPECATSSDSFACTYQKDQDFAKRGNSGYIYTSLYVRHWDTWEDGKQPHVFVVKPSQVSKGVWKISDQPIDTMSSLSGNSPIPPFGGSEQFDVSSDGTKIALTVENLRFDTAWTTGWDIYVSDLSVSPPTTKCLTDDDDARAENAVFSHSGDYLAYLQMARPGYEADRRQIYLLNLKTSQLTALATDWDLSPSVLVWTCDDQYLIADVDDDGAHNLYAISLTGQWYQLTSDGLSGSVSCVSSSSGTHKLLFTKSSMTYPSELFLLSFKISNQKATVSTGALTSYNTATISTFYMAQPEKFYFTSTDDVQVQGWLLRPYNWVNDGTKWPIAFLVHGGPESAWEDSWSYRWNPQLWASHGYAVVMINPRGSTGFGQNFTDAVQGQWGGVPYQDLMKGLSYISGVYPFLDTGRMCGCGASYGGYMINWMLGQTGKQFNCFVTHDGMFDTFASAYDTDELWFPYWEFNGVPYDDENQTTYAKWNPRAFVQNWQTPTLVIHGGKDYRLSETHGISVFTALQRLGIPSQFLYFPTENHWVTNPNNSILWYNTVLAWLDRWTGNQ